MRILTNAAVKRLFLAVSLCLTGFVVLSQLAVRLLPDCAPLCLLVLSLLAGGGILAGCVRYFRWQERTLEEAQAQINALLAGDCTARISCDEDGELFKLFHSVNTMAAVMAAHTDKETRAKEFLKNSIADISHQLKTPLSALIMYNEIIESEAGADTEAVLAFTKKSSASLARMEELIQTLLKVTRLDAGAVLFEKQKWLLRDVVLRAVSELQVRAAEEGKVILLAGSDELSVDCDLQWTGEAIGNLVKNALDYTDRGGQVFVSWEQFPERVRISVKDNGKGIAEKDIYHIFKRFYRASKENGVRQGIGLGLPLAKSIAEGQGGTLSVQSSLGEGTTFTLMLPSR